MKKLDRIRENLKLRNWSLLYKLIISYTGIFVVVLVMVVQMYHNNTVEDVERETISYAGLYLEQLNENINKYLDEFDRLSAMTLADGQLQTILASDVSDLSEDEHLSYSDYAETFLLNLYTLQPDIYSILLVDQAGYLYSEGIRRYSMEASGLDASFWYGKAIDAKGYATYDVHLIPDSYTDYLRTDRYLSVFRSIMPLGIQKSLGVIRIDVPLTKLHRLIESVDNSSRMKIIIVDDSGAVIYDPFGLKEALGIAYAELDETLSVKDEIQLEGESYIYLKDVSDYSGWQIYGFLPREMIVQATSKSRQTSVLFLIVGTLIIAVVSTILSVTITRPIKHLQHAMKKVEKGDYETRIQVGSQDEVGYLGESFNQMTDKIHQYIRTEYEMSIRTRDAELKALLEEISPHFLYNTLDSIRTKAIGNEDETVAEMIENLATFLRLNIIGGRDLCTVEEEVTHIVTYLKIYNIRHDDRFQYILDLDDRIRSITIPKLSLQPVIENALIHGFKNRTNNCLIILHGEIQEDQVVIEITDNGNGLDEDMLDRMNQSLHQQSAVSDFKVDHSHIGLNNVNQRLKIHFGKDYGLRLESLKGKGTKVILILPYGAVQEEGRSHE